MPRRCSTTFTAPCPIRRRGSLSTDETYAVTAYILSLNGIVPADGKVDRASLPKIRMPNRDGFVPEGSSASSTTPGSFREHAVTNALAVAISGVR